MSFIKGHFSERSQLDLDSSIIHKKVTIRSRSVIHKRSQLDLDSIKVTISLDSVVHKKVTQLEKVTIPIKVPIG